MPPVDNFSTYKAGLTSPIENGAVVVPSDSTEFTIQPRAIWVGGAGNISLVLGGTTITLNSVSAGTLLPIRPTRINSTGTTATSMVALW